MSSDTLLKSFFHTERTGRHKDFIHFLLFGRIFVFQNQKVHHFFPFRLTFVITSARRLCFRYGLSVRLSVCPSVPLSVCPSVCVQDNSKTTGRIFLKFGRHVGIDKSKRYGYELRDMAKRYGSDMAYVAVLPCLILFLLK